MVVWVLPKKTSASLNGNSPSVCFGVKTQGRFFCLALLLSQISFNDSLRDAGQAAELYPNIRFFRAALAITCVPFVGYDTDSMA